MIFVRHHAERSRLGTGISILRASETIIKEPPSSLTPDIGMYIVQIVQLTRLPSGSHRIGKVLISPRFIRSDQSLHGFNIRKAIHDNIHRRALDLSRRQGQMRSDISTSSTEGSQPGALP